MQAAQHPIPPPSDNPVGDRLFAARVAVGFRSQKAFADFLGEGFSRGKLARIESGTGTLSPRDADYVCRRLYLPTSFFTAPLGALGDVRAGADALIDRPSSPVEGLAADIGDALGQFDDLLDRQAEGESPDPRPADEDDPPQTGTQR